MKMNALIDKFYQTKLGMWSAKNPIKTGMIIAFASLFHTCGMKYLFTSPFNYQEDVIDFTLSLYSPLPDFIGYLLAGLTIGYGYQLMKGIKHYYKKTKKVFILGLISFGLTLTNGRNYLSMLSIGLKQTAYMWYYHLTNQEDKLDKLLACQSGKKETILDDNDYSLEGEFNKVFTESKNTQIYVSGTITNDTKETWDVVTVAIAIVDEHGNPKIVQASQKSPVLFAEATNVDPGQTVVFKTNVYPGVLESDYEGLVNYKLLGVKSIHFIKN